ncbi:MAG: PrsW family intramembrane metalloprotease [Candidatus Nealsonbacteria bacterium]|nr:PrsW family intramembrane metalloprotease [Candidatus Nealsonbacteria bacterium]
MSYFLYIILGLLPSFIWLCFFLRKDVHPESKRMILKIFIWGMASTLPIIFVVISLILLESLEDIKNMIGISIIGLALYVLFWATAEEVLKYLVVRYKVLRSSEFDEPIDIMLYMIIAGLGFAALENILILFGAHPLFTFPELFFLAFLRFISATFLHALCSGLIGYYMALSFFETKQRKKLLLFGIGIASLLHGVYNFPIIIIEKDIVYEPVLVIALISIPIIVLIGLAAFALVAFKKIKKLKSVCKI